MIRANELIAVQAMKSIVDHRVRLLIGLVVATIGLARAQPIPPTVATLPASALGATNATLNGMANPNDFPTAGFFEWGTTTNYDNVTPVQPLGSGGGNTNFSHELTNLTVGVGYHFRAVVSNSFYLVVGTNQSFTAPFPTLNQILFSDNFDVDHTTNWVVNQGPGANYAYFFYNYALSGIPAAPHSAGTTRGLKLEADVGGNVFGGLSVSPLGQNFTGDYVLTFDIWWNFVGPAPLGGNGSTQVTGAGVGTSGMFAQWAGGGQESIHFGATGDGQIAFDYRAYSSAAGTGYTNLEIYAAGSRNSSSEYYTALGSNTPPAAQTALYPEQTGTTEPGAPAFRWHAGKIVKEGNLVTFSLNDLLIATVDASTVTLGGGNILFNQFDVNSSSSTNPNREFLEFGLIDNVVVTRLNGPQLHRITRLGNGQMQLTGTGKPGLNYNVEATSQLSPVGWAGTNIGNTVADNAGTIFFVDTNPPTYLRRFYRLREP